MTEELRVGGARLRAVVGDLTTQPVDVVVNAANEQLAHGGGVAAAISRAAGPRLQAESDAWVAAHGPVGPGQAATTDAHGLPAAKVVHVVGPRFRAGQDNARLLAQAVITALDAAARVGRAVALPAISAGVFGYPPDAAATVIATTCREWLVAHPGALDEVRLVGNDTAMTRRFAAGLDTPAAGAPPGGQEISSGSEASEASDARNRER